MIKRLIFKVLLLVVVPLCNYAQSNNRIAQYENLINGVWRSDSDTSLVISYERGLFKIFISHELVDSGTYRVAMASFCMEIDSVAKNYEDHAYYLMTEYGKDDIYCSAILELQQNVLVIRPDIMRAMNERYTKIH